MKGVLCRIVSKVMTNEELYVVAKKAFERNELKALLSGAEGYACELDRFVSGSMPTDIGRVIQEGIYSIYGEVDNADLITGYQNAVLELLRGNAVDIWLAYHICWTQMYKEVRGVAPFKFFTSDLINALRESIQLHVRELRQTKEWQGTSFEDGLLGDIYTLEQTLHKHMGVSLL